MAEQHVKHIDKCVYIYVWHIYMYDNMCIYIYSYIPRKKTYFGTWMSGAHSLWKGNWAFGTRCQWCGFEWRTALGDLCTGSVGLPRRKILDIREELGLQGRSNRSFLMDVVQPEGYLADCFPQFSYELWSWKIVSLETWWDLYILDLWNFQPSELWQGAGAGHARKKPQDTMESYGKDWPKMCGLFFCFFSWISLSGMMDDMDWYSLQYPVWIRISHHSSWHGSIHITVSGYSGW